MEWDLRPVAAEEIVALAEAERSAFHAPPRPEGRSEPNAWDLAELDRTLAAFDGGEIVGVGRIYSFELVVPGGAGVAAGGVSWIGVLPTHRRRGILSAMMRRQLDDAVERGEPMLVLTASEGGIYRRYGYGVSTWSMAVTVDATRSAFLRDVETRGRLRLIDEAEAAEKLPAVFDRARRGRPGSVSRPDAWWPSELFAPDHGDGTPAGARFYVLHEERGGEADGYVAYGVAGTWEHGIPAKKATVRDMVTADPGVRALLWRYVFDLDLVTKVESWTTPVDDPLRWLLADARQLNRSSVGDWLWTRLLDVPAALSARTYGAEGRVVIEVVDGVRKDVAGRYALDGAPEGAVCARTTQEPDLVLGAADLGAAYLGGVALSTLARAGLVEERSSGALTRADAMFASIPLPYCGTWF